MNAHELARFLNLAPLLPEGGFFRQTFKDKHLLNIDGQSRSASTCILYLLTSESFSAFHRVKGTEIFHFLQGDRAEIFVEEGSDLKRHLLGNSIADGEQPQFIVKPNTWQALRIAPGGNRGWALFSTTVSPGFEEEDFELGMRAELQKAFPQEAEPVKQLTRV